MGEFTWLHETSKGAPKRPKHLIPNHRCSFNVFQKRCNLLFFVPVTDYLSRIITSHSAHACDGQHLRLHCPRHSTVSIQSAFYGSSGAWLCRADPEPVRVLNHSCSAFTTLQVFSVGYTAFYFNRVVNNCPPVSADLFLWISLPPFYIVKHLLASISQPVSAPFSLSTLCSLWCLPSHSAY